MSQLPHRRHVVCASVLFAALALAVPAAADLPDSPDGTVEGVLQALADNHPEVFWQALPASYQADITQITHTMADKMDPEMWSAIFATGSKAAQVLRDKREYILESSLMDAAGEERSRIEANWETGVHAMESFFSSDLADLETLKTMDWEHFLSTTGTSIMDRIVAVAAEAEEPEDIIATLRATTVETISEEGDSATVRVSAPGEDPEELPLTRVEGRWVPADLASEWESERDSMMENLENITEEQMAETAMQVSMIMGMVDGTLDQIAATESQEEFDQVIGALFGQFFMPAGEEMMEMEMEEFEQSEADDE